MKILKSFEDLQIEWIKRERAFNKKARREMVKNNPKG